MSLLPSKTVFAGEHNEHSALANLLGFLYLIMRLEKAHGPILDAPHLFHLLITTPLPGMPEMNRPRDRSRSPNRRPPNVMNNGGRQSFHLYKEAY